MLGEGGSGPVQGWDCMLAKGCIGRWAGLGVGSPGDGGRSGSRRGSEEEMEGDVRGSVVVCVCICVVV